MRGVAHAWGQEAGNSCSPDSSAPFYSHVWQQDSSGRQGRSTNPWALAVAAHQGCWLQGLLLLQQLVELAAVVAAVVAEQQAAVHALPLRVAAEVAVAAADQPQGVLPWVLVAGAAAAAAAGQELMSLGQPLLSVVMVLLLGPRLPGP